MADRSMKFSSLRMLPGNGQRIGAFIAFSGMVAIVLPLRRLRRRRLQFASSSASGMPGEALIEPCAQFFIALD
jgi:hypothetical protein